MSAAEKLIELVGDFIGGALLPEQTRRVAHAQADADVIAQDAKFKLALRDRAFNRFVAEEERRQQNIEAISQLAIPHLQETAKPEEVSSDWIANFFDKSKLVSDEEMQKVWARILAGEANAPGSISKHTVNIVAAMDSRDGMRFEALCRFKMTIGDATEPIIARWSHKTYHSLGINMEVLLHLEAIGLIQTHFDIRMKLIELNKVVEYKYFEKTGSVQIAGSTFTLGEATFTQAGRQLASICAPEPVPGFLEYLAWELRIDDIVFLE